MLRSMWQHFCTSGSSIRIGWKRRVSAGSFSMYWRYSDQVVAAMVRSVPRAKAGLSRLAASPVPADPPAPIRVWASSMNRMMGVGELCTSSITERNRLSNSPFIDAPDCQPSGTGERAEVLFLRARRYLAMLAGEEIDRNLREFPRRTGNGAGQLAGLQGADEQMTCPDLGLTEKQGRIVPAAVEQVHD